MLAISLRTMNVRNRIDRPTCFSRLVKRFVVYPFRDKHVFRFQHARWLVRETSYRNRRATYRLRSDFNKHGYRSKGKVAVAPGKFHKRTPMPFWPRLELQASYYFVRFNGGRHIESGKIGHRYFPSLVRPANFNDSIVSHRDRGQFGSRIKMTKAAAYRAAISCLTVPDRKQRLIHQRQTLLDHRAELKFPLPCHRSNANDIIFFRDVR